MLFSIVLPYKNRAAFLPRTLQSLVVQRHRPLELLLVDNGSSDAGPQLCEAFRREQERPDFRVRLLCEPDGGACRARNAGLQEAIGDFVYFFDSDDEISPAFLSDVWRVLRERPFDVVAARTVMVFPDGRRKVRKAYANADVADQVLTAMLSTQSFVARSSFLRRIGGWNEDLPKWNDWELGIRMLCARPSLTWLPGAYHSIHQHPDSLTGPSLAATYSRIRPALDAVSRLPDLDVAARRALNFRKAMLAAHMKRAGKEAEAQELFGEVVADGPDSLLRLLYVYMLRGGRGGWWWFRTLSRLF